MGSHEILVGISLKSQWEFDMGSNEEIKRKKFKAILTFWPSLISIIYFTGRYIQAGFQAAWTGHGYSQVGAA